MNYIKRAFLSVVKRKVKAFILILVLGVLGNMVLAGLSIQSATSKAGEFARKKLGGAVTLEPDFDKTIAKLNENGGGAVSINLPALTVDIAEKYSTSKYVAAYNYNTFAMAAAGDFKAVEVDNSNKNKGVVTGAATVQIGTAGTMAEPDVSLTGALNSDLISDFTEGSSKLVEGRAITKEDSDKKVAIIEKNLASKNNLKLGSKIKMKSLDGKKEEEFEIIGIFEAKENAAGGIGMGMKFMSPYNKIYVPFSQASGLKPVMEGTTGENNIDSAVYYIDDPLNIENFKNEVNQIGLDTDKYKLDAKDSLYKQMMGPIDNVASFSKTVVFLVTAAGAVILALIIVLSLKDRKYEIGVLLSLGESRIKIAGQLLAETLLVACIAFSLSTFTGKAIAQNIGNSLLQNEIKTSEKQSETVSMTPKLVRIGPGGVMNNTSAEPIDKIDVSVTGSDIEKLMLIGILIVLLSTVVPTFSVLRFNPRIILTKNE